MTESTHSSRSQWLFPLVLVIFCLGLYFFGLGSYPLFDVDEPRYAEAAREMIESGNWVTPYFNYVVRFDKPIFFYWLIAWAYQWFGVTEFAARFFSAVSATLLVLGTYGVCARLGYSTLGLMAGLIVATSLQVIGVARMSITDMTLACWMTLTQVALLLAILRSPKWWLAAGFCAGIGILTKGPVALVIPGAIAMLYTLWVKRFKVTFLNRWFPVGLVLALAIAFPWYWLAYQENGPIFLDALLFHNVDRFSSVVSNHYQPAWFFFAVFIVGFLPWTPFLPSTLHYWLLHTRQHHRQWIQEGHTPYLIFAYGLVWWLFTLLFFTVSNTKLLTYIQSLYPGLSLMVATAWHQLSVVRSDDTQSLKAGFQRWGWVLAAILTVVGVVFVSNPGQFLPREARHLAGSTGAIWPVIVLASGTVLTAVAAFRQRWLTALATQSLTMTLFTILAVRFIVPDISHAAQGTLIEYLRIADGKPFITYETIKPSLTFYGRRRIAHVSLKDYAELEAAARVHGSVYVLTKTRFMKTLQPNPMPSVNVAIIRQDKRYTLLKLDYRPTMSLQPNRGSLNR
jgi:4-amino-4-deoxy-L-arabinose transferase-like glycosyltransferase